MIIEVEIPVDVHYEPCDGSYCEDIEIERESIDITPELDDLMDYLHLNIAFSSDDKESIAKEICNFLMNCDYINFDELSGDDDFIDILCENHADEINEFKESLKQ